MELAVWNLILRWIYVYFFVKVGEPDFDKKKKAASTAYAAILENI
jgi:hypothetical protein